MPTISPEELREQLRDAVSLLASPASDQEAWLTRNGYPVDELALQLADAVPGWFPRLRRFQLITPTAESRLMELDQALLDLTNQKKANLWTQAALEGAPGWARIRIIAATALASLVD